MVICATTPFGDEDGSGHRGVSGLSGWGWVNHVPNSGGVLWGTNDDLDHHEYASDWLFEADLIEVPEPSTYALLLGTLDMVGLARRRQR